MPVKDYAFDLVGLGVSAGLTYTLYQFVRAGRDVVYHLKQTPELEINAGLIGRVAESGGGLIACVRGVVKASDIALKSVARPELTVDSSTSNVPFMLMDKGIGVQITEPGKLEDVDLTVVNEKFDAATNSLADHVWGWMKGVRTTGTQQTEEMLVEGTSVLGIGRLVLKNEGLHLEHSDLIPYMITMKNKKDIEAPIPYLRLLGLLTACGMVFYSYRVVSRWYVKWRKDARRRAEESILDEARARREAQGHDLPESLMCVVCCGLRDVLLMPCRHVCVCSDCALKLEPRVCPVCRTDIERIQPVFYS
ncbi:Mitochondrial E3 ubiquitin protein ligase 1-like [Homarus americanus]|uniref:RING-type E3 ubiquitin transferase n=1 Tax=Homarus americanus TaxID=6706 RepID=A0A8J5MQI6_HOMAM|nr:Mitochondrial E3 ubiquitin protein ligase 1-like [Homarus americanus]